MFVTIYSDKLTKGQQLAVKRKGEFFEFINDEVIGRIPAKDIGLRMDEYRAIVRENDKDSNASIEIVTSVPLHTHTGYSLLDGAIRIDDLVSRLDYAGAITDHGAMYGFLDFYKKMKKAGKKPIIGMEAYVETLDGKKKGNHLILLAENKAGYRNLIKLSSAGFTNFYSKPHVSMKMLREHHEGIIATSACLKGAIPEALVEGSYDRAKEVAQTYIDIFGAENFFIEIQRHGIEDEMRIEKDLLRLAEELSVGIVGTTDSHYLDADDTEAHEVLLCIQTQATMYEPHMKFDGNGYHLHTIREMENIFFDIPEALDNTLLIAERCNVEIELNNVNMPPYEIPEGYKSMDSYFRHLCHEGYKERYSEEEQAAYLSQLEYEIDMILKMGFAQYFVIVWDFLRWAREQGIMIGPGRGSAAGSVVAYSLRITDIDPMKYDLFFERFLNPERISWPDIDSDVEFDRRGEVIEYITNKYGEENVCRIITFGTMAARMAVRDVSRAMGMPASFGDRLAKLIPAELKMTVTKALRINGELQNLYDTDESVKKILDISCKLEGLPRHASQHACGVVISPSKVEEFIPTAMAINKDTGVKEQTSQVTMSEVEELGLLKMDILGLKTMGVISNCFRLIKENHGVELTMDKIDLNDRKVYQFLRDGHTGGVFQFEGKGMTDLINQMYKDVDSLPDEDLHQLFERAIAAVSLYRPGPMDYIPEYIQNMNNPSDIKYDHEMLEPILKKTYGVIVYQEQVMQIVQALAGYTLGRADVVRRAMGKKKEDVMAKEMTVFINGDKKAGTPGCKNNGVDEKVAEIIWGKMAKFAEYAFNKSHATAYAYLAIITAYLSCYYPKEFRASLLNAYLDSAEKQKVYIAQCVQAGVEILPPDVNNSNEYYSVEGDGIRFGFRGLKDINKISTAIVQERDERGEFTNLHNFFERMVKYREINKKATESLIYAGAFDCFGYTRATLIHNAPLILQGEVADKKSQIDGQVSIFDIQPEMKDLAVDEMTILDEIPRSELLRKEKEFAGYYISGHPLDDYINRGLPEGYMQLTEILESGKDMIWDVHSVGIITEVKRFYTKEKMDPIISFKIEDRYSEMSCVLFKDNIDENAHLIEVDTPVVVRGNFSISENWGPQIVVKMVMGIDTLKKNWPPERVVVAIRTKEEQTRLRELARSNRGATQLMSKTRGGEVRETIYKINCSLEVMQKLQEGFSEVVVN